METRIILTITHKAPIPDLIDKVANRVWSLQGVDDADAALDDFVKFLDKEPQLAQPVNAALAKQAGQLRELREAAWAVLSNEEHAFSCGIRKYQIGSPTWQVYQDLRTAAEVPATAQKDTTA